MNPQIMGEIPAETARIARAACPKGTLAMRLRDTLGEVYEDEQFLDLYPVEGQPAYAPWRLALVTVLQYTENLTDRQAANAVRERLDWKYGLGLERERSGVRLLAALWVSHAADRAQGRDALAGSAAGGVQRARLAEPRGANNAPISRMCWRGCARFPTWSA